MIMSHEIVSSCHNTCSYQWNQHIDIIFNTSWKGLCSEFSKDKFQTFQIYINTIVRTDCQRVDIGAHLCIVTVSERARNPRYFDSCMIRILRHGTIPIYPKVCNILYGIKIRVIKLSHITIPEYHYTPNLEVSIVGTWLKILTAIDICESGCLPVIQSWFGEWFDSVRSGWSFHMVMNCAKLLLMRGMKTKWRQKRWTSLSGSSIPVSSM